MEMMIGKALLYEKLRKPIIYHLHSKYQPDKYSAEDIFQDTFISYYKSLDKLENSSERDLVNWIYKANTNNYRQNFSSLYRHKSLYKDKPYKLSIQDNTEEVNQILRAFGVNDTLEEKYLEDFFLLGLNRSEKRFIN